MVLIDDQQPQPTIPRWIAEVASFEREADATGVALLEKLGLRADGIAGFFEEMLEKEPKDAASAAGISSASPAALSGRPRHKDTSASHWFA